MEIKNKLYTTLLVTLMFVAAFASNVFAASVQGRIDNVNSDGVAGWAALSEGDAAYAEVVISIKDSVTNEIIDTLTTTANAHRDDLKAFGNKSGDFCFFVQPDWESYGDGVYYVEASVNGIKLANPMRYTQGDTSSQVLLGVFKTTAYCPCISCSEGWGRHTSTGAIASSSHTIAVDPRVIPYGTKVMINGIIYTAEDRGGGVKGNHIDIFYDTHAETYTHGVQYIEVYSVS